MCFVVKNLFDDFKVLNNSMEEKVMVRELLLQITGCNPSKVT